MKRRTFLHRSLAATSLSGGGFGGEYRLEPGVGVDGEAVRTETASVLRREDGKIGYAAIPLIAGSQLVGLFGLAQPGQSRRADCRGRARRQDVGITP